MRWLSVVSALFAGTAFAQCTDLCFCLPSPPQAPGVVQAHIVSVTGPRTDFELDAVFGTAPGSSSFTLPREEGDEVGGSWLIFYEDQRLWRRAPIVNQTLSCSGVQISIADARAMYAGKSCSSELLEHGVQLVCQPPHARTCSAAPVCLLSCLAWLFTRRRRTTSRPSRLSSP